ncbi:MAG: 2-isopropylmalate synthase [Acidimicrobiales bacterium]|nr:2-isopropylmalate synthase [Acidimicrobiales bacterium]
MADRLTIFDTTLRDGEQSPGISLDAGEKLEIAEQLARLGVDVIEAGFPVASEGDFEAVKAIAATVSGPVICGLSRPHLSDVDRCWEAVRPAAPRARIHVFISTSPNHMEHMLKMTPEQVVAATRSGVARAREHTDDVEFSPQDATRTPLDFMIEVLQAAVEAGATTLNIPDTVGYGIPWSLAGVQAGARQVEVCVNGLGERAGNAALEEVVMALRIRPDQFPGVEVGVRTEELARTSRMVARLTGYPIQYNKAVVGRNAFSHESGIHQHGVLADRSTYEIIDADAVGSTGSQIVLGKHSGRHAFANALKELGITVHGDTLDAAFRRFKELADRKVQLTDADLEAIVAEELGTHVGDGFELESLEVRGGTVGTPAATVVVLRGGEKLEATSEGDGMIDAACRAIKDATGVDGRLVEFNVSSVTGGVDALGDVVVQVEAEGVRVSGRGLSTDVVEASARAYLSAVNRLLRVRDRAEARRTVEATP